MVQTAYPLEPGLLKPGMKADLIDDDCLTYKNTTGADVPFGVMMQLGAADDRAARVSGFANKLIGVVVHDHISSNQGFAYVSDPPFGGAEVNYGVANGKIIACMRKGAIMVAVEGAVVAEGPAYVRVAANGPNALIGGFRGDSDGGTCLLLRGAKFRSSQTAAGFAILFLFGDIGFASGGNAALGSTEGSISLVPGAEVANAIDVVGSILNTDGSPVVGVRNVRISSLPTTAGQGALAAATAPVGTGLFSQNPITGDNNASIVTTAAGLFSVKVSNTGAEVNDLLVTADGCLPRVLRLTFV